MTKHSQSSGSDLFVHQVKQSGTKRYKARLPIIQRLSYSVGHFLNDAVVSAWTSYLLVFLTKVIGLSNRTAGFLLIVSYTMDAVLGVVVGYICDNHQFPLLARYYGKRKSFHLLGTVLVAGLFPFLMMPCFVCGDDSSQWKMGLYYGTIMILHNIGWALSQCTHLALIPEIAKRPNEMVELHALRSGITFISGIFMYVVTWILLRTDGADERISASQWKDFMEMAVIVVGTGCFFSLIFHLGTKEPPSMARNDKGAPDGFIGQERQRSHTATLPLPDKAVGFFCLYDKRDVSTVPADDSSTDVIKAEEAANTVVENKRAYSFEKKDVDSCVIDLEKIKKNSEFSFSNPAFKTIDEATMDGIEEAVVVSNEASNTESSEKSTEKLSKEYEFSFANPGFIRGVKQSLEGEISQETTMGGAEEAVVVLNDASVTESSEKSMEQLSKEYEFSFANPGFINGDKQSLEGEILQETNRIDPQPTKADKKAAVGLDEDAGAETSKKSMEQPRKENEFSFLSPLSISENKQSAEGEILQEVSRIDSVRQLENLEEERLSNRSDSSGFSEGYASSPETVSVDSAEVSFAESKSRIGQVDYTKKEISSETRPRSPSIGRNRANSFTKGTDTSYSGVIIEEVNKLDAKRSKTRKTWSDWFKTPMFYKISFAYMCARLAQIITGSYAPMYLTDTLGFEKESIAYFPLVILISGVFSSLGAKKFDKMLGAKWTYCLASSLVIGSSAWFYLQGTSGTNSVYCAATLMGCGSSVMYVTSLALVGELIGDNKESGAFVFSSIGVLVKVVSGSSIFVIQEFFPSHGSTAEYVRYVFSVVPGAGAILGFLAVIAFLPATVRCRKVVHTVDSSAQTEDISDVLYAYDNPALYNGNDTDINVSSGMPARLVS